MLSGNSWDWETLWPKGRLVSGPQASHSSNHTLLACQIHVSRCNPNPVWVFKASSFIRNICLFTSSQVVSHSLRPLCVWKLLRRQEWSKRCACRLDFPRMCDEQANARHSSLCSSLIACFPQTQRLVPLPAMPRRGWVSDEKGAENRISVIRI